MLQVKDLDCTIAKNNILQSMSFELEKGQSLALLGKSGCGKSTTLRCIAGVELPSNGEITLESQLLYVHGKYNMPAEKRNIAMIFQDYALFPHLNLFDNIAFGLFDHSRSSRRSIVKEMLDLVKLPESYAKRYPYQLSGGQKQRVAIARSLAISPKLMLLDEPFSNIDVAIRYELMHETKALLQSRNITSILVTHAKEEAFCFGDKVAIMENGKMLQIDAPEALYKSPLSLEAAKLLSKGTVLNASFDGCVLKTALGNFAYPNSHWQVGNYQVFIRYDVVEIFPKENNLAKIAI